MIEEPNTAIDPKTEDLPLSLREQQVVDSSQVDATSTFDLLQCCHPKSAGDSCWTALTTLFHPRQDQATTKTITSEAASDENALKDKVVAPQRSSSDEKIKPQPPQPKPLTQEEKTKLSNILEILLQNAKKSEQEGGSDSNSSADAEEKKESIISSTDDNNVSSFLLELAKAAAEVAFEDASYKDKTTRQEDATSFKDDPEAAIQRLLQAGKRTEALQQRQQEHLQRVENLFKEHSKLVVEQHPLENHWKALEESITKPEDPTTPVEMHFHSVMSQVLGKHGEAGTLELLWNKEEDDNAGFYNLIQLCFHLALAHAFLTVRDAKGQEKLQKSTKDMIASDKNGTDQALQAMVQSFQAFQQQKQETQDERENFLQWQREQAPTLLSALSLCMHAILFPSLEEGEDNKAAAGWLLPSLDHQEGFLFSTQTWLFTVASTLPMHHHKRVGPIWHALYSSHSEGFNLSTLQHSLTGYHGPTLLLVEGFDKDTKTHQIFGAFASQPWTKQSSPDFYGNGDSFLFQLQPQFQVFRAKPSGLPNYQYFYFDNRPIRPTTTTSGEAKNRHESGLGLGGSRRRPRFFVSACLDTCHFGSSDATFETNETATAPPHFSSSSWDLLSLEIWGVGGESALRALTRHRSVEEANMQKARQVDKAAFLNDFRSGLIESKMFGHREELRNRDGGCLLDCHDDDEEDGNWQIGAPR